MTTIERLKRKKGDAFRIRYYFDGRRFKISLPAGISRARVNEFANVVDALVAARKYAENPPRAVATFLQDAPPIFLNKLARVGLIAIEKPITLEQAAETFLARVKATLKTRSYEIRLAALRLLLDHFGRDAPVLSIDSTAAASFVATLGDRYAQNTVKTHVESYKAFFRSLVDSNAITANPFAKIPVNVGARLNRVYNVPSEWTGLILNACATARDRCLFMLYRYGALRAAEAVALRWSGIDWERRRLIVPSAKTERFEGRASRVIPLFPELENALFELFETIPEGAPDQIFSLTPKAAYKIIYAAVERAGLRPWSKLLQNMRATRENELVAAGYPEHVVAAWLGHTPKTQTRYYLRVLDVYFDRATGGNSSGPIKGPETSENGRFLAQNS